MNTRQKGLPPPAAFITLRDVYYILFRHKWMITILVVLGVATSTAIYSLWPFPYTSEAEILIRYVQDTTAPSVIDGTAKPKFLDDRGSGILNTEVRILTSRDLAYQIATNVGPEKILGKSVDSNSAPVLAAALITLNLKAEVQRDCDVIALQFTGNDPVVVQQVLFGLIAAYRSKYVEIHLSPGVSDAYLQEKTDESHARLVDALNALKDEKAKRGITSLEDAKRNQADLIARITESTLQIQADLAEAESNVKDLQERVSGTKPAPSTTNQPAGATWAAIIPPPSQEVVAKYQNLITTLNTRSSTERDLLTQYTPNSVKVQIAQKQRMAAEAEMRHFVAENPGVLTLKPADLNGPGLGVAPAVDLNASLQTATARMHALMAKYNQLTNQLTVVRAQASDLDNGEDKIMQAQTDRDAAEAKYKNFQFSAEQASINEAVGNKVSNINVIELPTPGGRDKHKMLKMAEGILGFFLALAFGLPFLIELVLDQTLKSPLDVQARIASPFFITMPRTNGHGKLGALKRAKNVPLLPANGSQTPGPGVEGQTLSAPANGAVAPWDERHELRPFFETLRDRLMTYFEMINLTHKPKLVAVTSCNAGAGVTTTAAGLASSLSETGEGNVLLVSMNSGDGEAHHFYKGKLTCRIEDALEREKRNPGQVHGNLYVAKEMEADDKLPRVLPKRFSHLVPMMKASDFDYIIFDMPPVSEISITPRLARFMDMVLLVIESEKTSRDAAVRATSLLAESKTNVGLVLNKNRSYVPKRLEQSL